MSKTLYLRIPAPPPAPHDKKKEKKKKKKRKEKIIKKSNKIENVGESGLSENPWRR